MGRIFRFILKSIVVVVLLVVISAAALVFFVNANNLKPFIAKKVYQMTGQELAMEGPLSWSFFPTLGISGSHLGLKNSPGSQNPYSVEADGVRFGVLLMPLLHGEIKAGSLVISNASVQYTDSATQQSILLTHLNVHADSANLTEAFPLQLAFDFKTVDPVVTGHVTVSGSAAGSPNAAEYSLRDMAVKAAVQSGKAHADLQMEGNLLADTRQGLYRWQDLTGNVANMKVRGELHLTRSPAQMVTAGQMRIDPFDLKKFLQQTGLDIPSLQQADEVNGTVNLSMVSGGTVSVDGTLQAPDMRVAKLALQNISVPFQLTNGVLDIESGSASLYDGKATLKSIARLQTVPMQFATQLGLTGIQVAPLLRDLQGDKKLSVSGVGSVALILSTSGDDSATCLNNLSGTANFSVKDGMLRGIDIPYLLDTAMTLAGQKVPATMQGNTPFTSLTGTALIHNGVVSNSDLLLDSPRFTVNGKGTVNLPAYRIDYALQAQVSKTSANGPDDISNLYGLPVPIVISGALDDPSVRLDSATLLQALAKQQLKSRASDLIKNNIPSQAGSVLNKLLGQ